MLAEAPCNVGGMCDALGMNQPATSHHLALLRHGRIIEGAREGKTIVYELTEAGQDLAKLVKEICG